MRAKEDRTQRVSFGGQRLKLDVDQATKDRLKKEDKVPRWINDVSTQLEDARRGGYEFVNDSGPDFIEVGGAKQDRDRRIKVDVGKGAIAYLMAIPREFYDEDQAAKEERNFRVDESIRGGKPQGTPDHGVNPRLGKTYRKNVEYKP
jgi:hypothetical protein